MTTEVPSPQCFNYFQQAFDCLLISIKSLRALCFEKEQGALECSPSTEFLPVRFEALGSIPAPPTQKKRAVDLKGQHFPFPSLKWQRDLFSLHLQLFTARKFFKRKKFTLPCLIILNWMSFQKRKFELLAHEWQVLKYIKCTELWDTWNKVTRARKHNTHF